MSGGVLIRVGGGWTDIDEYYEKHEETEVNNMEIQDRRFQESPNYDVSVIESQGNDGNSYKPMEFARAQSLKKDILKTISKKINEKATTPRYN